MRSPSLVDAGSARGRVGVGVAGSRMGESASGASVAMEEGCPPPGGVDDGLTGAPFAVTARQGGEIPSTVIDGYPSAFPGRALLSRSRDRLSGQPVRHSQRNRHLRGLALTVRKSRNWFATTHEL